MFELLIRWDGKKSKRGFIQVIMLEMLVSKVLELLGGNSFQYFG